jgi:hypothetical protein
MENNTFGVLFDTINLDSEEHFEAIINAMDNKSAVFIISHAIESAHRRGLFTLNECEVLSKALRLIKTNNVEEVKD